MFYTFYSYKGGAGRSLALSNVAVLLQRRGLNVVAVDCDFKAPALESYLFPGDDGGSRQGLVDLIEAFKEAMSLPSPGDGGKSPLKLPRIADYLHPADSNGKGSIRLMPAGRRLGEHYGTYAERVCRFDWDDFYHHWDGELFFKWLKRDLRDTRADVVLLNSPAGITEMGRVCTGQLASVVVMFCPPDPLSRTGTLRLAVELAGGREVARAAAAYATAGGTRSAIGVAGRWAERAEDESPVRLIIVPARVEERKETEDLLKTFRKDFVRDFEPFLPEDKKPKPPFEDEDASDYFWKLRVPYVPTCSYTDVLAARSEGVAEAQSMVVAYDSLVVAMARFAQKGSALNRLADDTPTELESPGRLEGVEPYRSLEPFYEKHSRLFFGRGECVDHLLGQVRRGGMISVVGQSGSGKSSLVHAGLLPRLRDEQQRGHKSWKIVILTPDTQPLEKLADELCRQSLEPGVEPLGEPAQVAARLEKEAGSLARLVSHMLRGLPDGAQMLLVVDQFEELITLSHPAECAAFLDQLVNAVGAGGLTVVFTMRQDFYDEFMEQHPELAEAVGDRVLRLGQMGTRGLREAVTRPAELMGLTFEPGLVDRILSDVGKEPGNLPLLQFALTKLWKGRDGARLTHHVYTESGGVKGAVAAEAEKLYASLKEEEAVITKRIFTHLVQLNENRHGPNTRRRATYAELGERARPVVKKLADARLLVAGGDDRGTAREDSRANQVEVAHEALIQTWPRFVLWLEEDREFLLARQRLWRAVADWKETGEESDALLRGQLLRNARELLSKRADDLSEPVKEFITRSVEYEGRQRVAQEEQRAVLEQQRRELKRRMRARALASGAAVIAIATIFYGWWTWRQTRNVVSAATYSIRGGEAERAGNEQAALDNYKKATELSPGLPDPYLASAFIYSRRGRGDDYERAVENFDKFLDIEKKSPAAFNGRGEVWRKMSEPDKPQLRENALKDFDRAIEQDSAYAPAWYNRASVLLEMGMYDAAIDSFSEALDTAPRFNGSGADSRTGQVEVAHVFNDRGKAFYARGQAGGAQDDIQRAREDFEQAATLGAPKFAEPLFNLGVILANSGQLTKAVEFYSRAVTINPAYGEALNARGDARAKLGSADEALADFAEAVRQGYRPAYLNLALAQLRRGDYRDAVENFGRSLDYQSDARAFLGRGEALAALGEHRRAIEDFSHALQLDGDLIDAYYGRGLSYDETDDDENAKADLLRFARAVEHPESPLTYGSHEYIKKLHDARTRLTKLGYKNAPADATVSLHYLDESDRPLALQVEAALKSAGFRRVTLSGSRSRDDSPLVKYFNGADHDNAFRVRAEVSRIFGRNINYWQMPPGKSRKDTFGLIEVWLPSSAPKETQPGEEPVPGTTPKDTPPPAN